MRTSYDPQGAIPPNNVAQRLFVLRGANMAITTDQAFTKIFSGTLWDPQTIVANWKSGAFNTACAGGVYMAASKGGTVVVPASQSWAGLTGANTQVNAAIQAFTATFSATPILSLTTGNTGALTCDIFIYGFCLD
jgi:hypothetical protein